ncbi:cyclin [Plectosphaerella cucumerina]|uniref:Cyclin n=1 Tax=Plectosphaerella cucumerina TaxID=40658 RepID=A0A8K0TF38_9PEZI|nr:cyclin [Plectosphaerella cucumerina]
MTGFDHDSSASIISSYHNIPYSSSLESNATTTSSIWSAAGSQSSNETSPSSSSSDLDPCDSYTLSRPVATRASTWTRPAPQQAPIAAVPTEQRLNPRRSGGSAARCPPSLARQCDRKVNFVDNLVDSSTQIVEAIWPLSSVVCHNELGSKAVLPLRTFIQETLRRSRTSYSTLQVALYYLVLIKPHVPKHDFTMEQPDDNHECRALQCGRRMFLSALILASKYLQDRNYSARAWSKISGLATQEINQNELAFLLAVDWKLHITDEVFQRWTEIVLKYTPPSPPSPGSSSPLYARQIAHWKMVILTLNAELNNVEGLIPTSSINLVARDGAFSPRNVPLPRQTSPVQHTGSEARELATPKAAYGALSAMEPSPSSVYSPGRHAPALGLLPTPRLTPQSPGCTTPAASGVSQLLCRGSAMGLAMAQAFNVTASHALDRFPASFTSSPTSYFARRSSLANSISTASSPESMVSDTSRTSRSSSISSASSLASAPTHSRVPARFRCAKLQGERVSVRSTIPEDFAEDRMSSSPESYSGPVGKLGDLCLDTPLARREQELDESDAARALQAMQGYSHSWEQRPTVSLSRKRSHPEFTGNALQDNVRDMLLRSKTSWPETLVRARSGAIEEGSPRKRVCCSAEAAEGIYAPNPHHPIGAHQGPGMWEGILN